MASDRKLPEPRSFANGTRRLAYRELGSGSRVVVLIHGLLMHGHMYAKLAPTLAERGYRVLVVDMLGHGASDQPHDMTRYSMPQFGADVIALLEHLEIERAVIGGTSLGANVALEAACAAPDHFCGLILEMPVLENGLAAAAAVFVPLALAIRVSRRFMGLIAGITRRIPRTVFLVDLLLDFVRRDPVASLAVLDGLTFGRVAPPQTLRCRLDHPTLVIGHPSDPIHPFSDAENTARELPNAKLVEAHSIYEWRLWPRRLDAELLSFLAGIWTVR